MKKYKVEGLTLSNFKTYKATKWCDIGIKTNCSIRQGRKSANRPINRGTSDFQQRLKGNLVVLGYPYWYSCAKKPLNSYFMPCIKITSKWIIDQSV